MAYSNQTALNCQRLHGNKKPDAREAHPAPRTGKNLTCEQSRRVEAVPVAAEPVVVPAPFTTVEAQVANV